jgi:cholesterol transport system auxiliary component
MMRHFPSCLQSAINSIAAHARQYRVMAIISLIISAGALSGCALPDKPTRATMYDFGPGTLLTQPATRQLTVPSLPPLAIDDIATSGGALDNMAVLYRLGYADAQQLRPYAQARWSMPPAQLVRQRLRVRA